MLHSVLVQTYENPLTLSSSLKRRAPKAGIPRGEDIPVSCTVDALSGSALGLFLSGRRPRVTETLPYCRGGIMKQSALKDQSISKSPLLNSENVTLFLRVQHQTFWIHGRQTEGGGGGGGDTHIVWGVMKAIF